MLHLFKIDLTISILLRTELQLYDAILSELIRSRSLVSRFKNFRTIISSGQSLASSKISRLSAATVILTT